MDLPLHETDKYMKRFTRFNQLATFLCIQIIGKKCLREIESDLRIQESTWRELGLKSFAFSTLARANAERSATIFESLFYAPFRQCQDLSQQRSFFIQKPRCMPSIPRPLPSVWNCLTGRSSVRRKELSVCTWIWTFAIKSQTSSI